MTKRTKKTMLIMFVAVDVALILLTLVHIALLISAPMPSPVPGKPLSPGIYCNNDRYYCS